MACFTPIQGFKSKFLTKNGKYSIVFDRRNALADGMFPMTVSCGQCIGCRLEYSRQWSIRCMHEASLHKDNCFITLTYNDKFLPRHGSLDFEHWEKFLKRLRRKYEDTTIRFFMGPEYGEKSHRPHYHAILFGLDFPDKKLHSVRNGYRLFTSPSLDSVWTCPRSRESYGFASVGSVTPESTAYVARYMNKKVKGIDVNLRYFARDKDGSFIFDDDGSLIPISPEKARMSNRPGLAHGWFEQFYQDVYSGGSDYVVFKGKKVRPPRYYDELFRRISPDALDSIKEQRVIDAKVFAPHSTPERLDVRRIVAEANLSRKVRNLE